MLLVLMNPAPGRDDDFEAWLDDHLEAMVQLAGFLRAHRLEHAGTGVQEYRHLAIYEVGGGQLATALASLEAAKAQGLISWSDAIDPRTAPMWFSPVASHARLD